VRRALWVNRLRSIIFILVMILSLKSVLRSEDDLTQEEKIRQARQFYLSGQRLIQKGDYAAANEEFNRAELLLAKDPAKALNISSAEVAKPEEAKSADYYYNQGVEQLKRKEFKEAESSFKQVMILNPQDPEASYNLGVLYEKHLKNKKEALKYYLRYINLSPGSKDAEEVKSWIKEINQGLGQAQ
jgi:outer membrane protein assembly factor BamD (BamD/ComL family)